MCLHCDFISVSEGTKHPGTQHSTSTDYHLSKQTHEDGRVKKEKHPPVLSPSARPLRNGPGTIRRRVSS